MLYNDKIENYEEIQTYSLEQTLSNETQSSYKLYENDYIKSNSSKICKINGFVTDNAFSGFEIKNVKYTTIKDTSQEIDTTNTSVNNTNSIKNEETENIISNEIFDEKVTNEITNNVN